MTNISFEDISDFICRNEKTTFDQINIDSRKRELVLIRHLIMKFTKDFTKMSLESIGNKFISGGDHSNVYCACRNIRNLYDTDVAWRTKIDFYNSHFLAMQEDMYIYIPVLPDLVDLKKIRLYCELSLRKAAAGIPMAKSYIYRIETGEKGSQLPYKTVKKMLMFYRKVAIEKGLNVISY